VLGSEVLGYRHESLEAPHSTIDVLVAHDAVSNPAAHSVESSNHRQNVGR
jgi:hypothetical protein